MAAAREQSKKGKKKKKGSDGERKDAGGYH